MNGYNQRAIRLYERLGFRLVGRVRGALMLNGSRYDQIIMDLLRTEFELKHLDRFQGRARAKCAMMAAQPPCCRYWGATSLSAGRVLALCIAI